MATNPNESDCKMKREPSPTFEEAANSFERNDTRIQKEVESQATTRQEDDLKQKSQQAPSFSELVIARLLVRCPYWALRRCVFRKDT